MKIGHVSRPYRGVGECGDRYGYWSTERRFVLALADGLGHGPEAAVAASAAMQCIAARLDDSCEELFAACDARLRPTRGAAMTLALIDRASRQMTLAAVGNTRALWLNRHGDMRLGGARGIVGAGYGHLAPETVTLTPGDIVVLFSDGLDEFPPLRQVLDRAELNLQQHAEAILERWSRLDDDAAVLVYQHE